MKTIELNAVRMGLLGTAVSFDGNFRKYLKSKIQISAKEFRRLFITNLYIFRKQ
jgi:hypothetical protein